MTDFWEENKQAMHYFALALFLAVIGLVFSILNNPEQKIEIEAASQSAGAIIVVTQIPLEEKPDPPKPILTTYVEIIKGCALYESNTCARSYAGPSEKYRKTKKFRIGTILKVDTPVLNDGRAWYKIHFDEWLRYPERTRGVLYIPEEYVRVFKDIGIQNLDEETLIPTNKYIIVDKSDQMLYAYENKKLFMSQSISSGLPKTPTPTGTFSIYKKTPTRYMQGPLPGVSPQYYDLPGVPWNLYFTKGGAVIHGAYWHNNFGRKWSHGCINVPLQESEKLYHWADLGIPVYVRD